jgi:hypothetical protein
MVWLMAIPGHHETAGACRPPARATSYASRGCESDRDARGWRESPRNLRGP